MLGQSRDILNQVHELVTSSLQGQHGSPEDSAAAVRPQATCPTAAARRSGVRGVRWDKVYGTNLHQVGPKKANLDQLGQVGLRFAVFCLLKKSTFDQLGPSWSSTLPTVFRALPRRGDPKAEVSDADVCRVGEVVLIGGKEAWTVISKSSLIFRVPLDSEHPEGTTVKHIRDNEFLQIEGEDLYVYARDLEGNVHVQC